MKFSYDEHLLQVEEMSNGDLLVKIPPKLYQRMQQLITEKQIDSTVEEQFKQGLLDLIEHKHDQTTLI